MEKETRNRIQRATQAARQLIEQEYSEQLEGTFDILLDGTISDDPGDHLSESQCIVRQKLIEAIAHKQSAGMKPRAAVEAYLREAAFTMLNRLVALKMLEARGIVQECVSGAEESSGFKEFIALAPGFGALEDKGYRLYIESIFDEISREVGILFDRRDVASLLWPRRQALEGLLEILNDTELASVWEKDETIGWVYQYFNGDEERTKMRAESQAPRNSRELAVRNQFFTPRYVVQFLTDNTLGRTWYEMMQSETQLSQLDYLVRRPNEVFLAEGESAPESSEGDSDLSQEDLLQRAVYVPFRAKKDPRDLLILDPACGSGHFLLYAFDLFITIYEEAWADEESAAFTETGSRLRADYGGIKELWRAMPELILRHNLHGVDIDPRAAQIAALALWMRAQRAYAMLEVSRGERSPVTKTNIVVAEPMPGDSELVEEFAASLKPAVLGDLFKKMAGEMKLAGELGSLLKIEESIVEAVRDAEEEHRQGNLFAERVEDQGFWTEADARIISELGRFSEAAAGSAGIRRKLFAGDAAQGVALIEMMRKRFDAVLMNPPFGQSPKSVFQLLKREYPDSYIDLFAAFVSRGMSTLKSEGLLGCISSRSFLTISRLERWRSNQVIGSIGPLLDLGRDVMDSALVESCAYVMRPRHARPSFMVFDAQEHEKDRTSTDSLIRDPTIPTYCTSRGRYYNIPGSKMLYSLPNRIVDLITTSRRLEPLTATVRQGMATFDNFRFLRLRWEVSTGSIGIGKTWEPLAKGGEYAPYYGDIHLLVKWHHDGRELGEINRQHNGQEAQVRQASTFWRERGATYSMRSSRGFSARALPAGCIIAAKGPAVLSRSKVDAAYLVGWLNSRLIKFLIELQANANEYTSGIVKTLPWEDPDEDSRTRMERLATDAIQRTLAIAALDECDPHFQFSGLARIPLDADLNSSLAALQAYVQRELTTIAEAMGEWDRYVDTLYGVDSTKTTLASEADGVEGDLLPQLNLDMLRREDSLQHAISSYVLGVAFGRWCAHWRSAGEFEDHCSAFSALSFADGDRDQLTGDSNGESTSSGILVDDEGAQGDIVAHVLRLVSEFSDTIATTPSFSDNVRSTLARRFFDFHIKQYSKSRRKAPIYWQLATPSASYSVWCYYHLLTRDTFFRVASGFVTPKVDHEERKLYALRQEAGADPSSNQRRAIDAQGTYVAELRAFKNEVDRIAPLWNPNLNDGVIINFAPLWRLVPQHKAWQKDCKKVWDKLVKGDLDWAHLAMHLWPERVVPKCAEDRSLAIAHDLEDAFWIEGGDGKFHQREVDDSQIKTLVEERTSPAVKAALDDLLSAPAPVNAKAKRGRKRSSKKAKD